MDTPEEKSLLHESRIDDSGSEESDDHHASDNETEEKTFAHSAVRHGDRDILKEPEEEARLLRKGGRIRDIKDVFSNRRTANSGKKISRRTERRRSKKKSKKGTDSIFENEEGFKDNSSQSSLDLDLPNKWNEKAAKRRRTCGRLALVHVLIIILFCGLVYGTYKVSQQQKSSQSTLSTLSNGTHAFRPTTILISLDGFRADFLNRDITPALAAFIASGVSPKYLIPSFPSVTFPNHLTLVTGLYPESHGIVSNQFWDPELQEEFYYTNTDISMQPKWWNAEPLWVTAENQGLRTAIHMWPGSEAHIAGIEPTYLDKYNGTEELPRKVARLLEWLDLPGDENSAEGNKRPQFIAAYVPNVDVDGHKYGPNSTEIRATIADVDSMLTMLMEGLYQRNLTEIINLVVVSDHGMATTSTNRLIQLEDLIDLSLIDHIDGWPLRGLRLKNPDRDVPILYEKLLKSARDSGNFDVYTLETMPKRYHFSHNDRIAPLWLIPKTGWAIVEKHDFNVAEAQTIGRKFEPMGLHGYDHEHPLMRAIFVARGPAFPHPPNSRIPTFQNIEVYNIICDSLGINPHPNNGTLRLPLTVEGLHGDDKDSEIETPYDQPDDSASPTETGPSLSNSSEAPTTTSSPVDSSKIPENPEAAEAPGNSSEPNDPENDNNPASKSSWWNYLHDELGKAKEWAKEFIDSIKNNKANGKNDPPQT